VLGLVLALAVPTPATDAQTVPAVLPVEVPGELTAKAAIAVDLDSGLLLFAHNPDTPLPPASTAKMITALAARRVLDPAEVVTISMPDGLAEDASRMGIKPGDTVTVLDLLQGLMIASGGDAALELARLAGARLAPDAPDPVARFVEEMNAEAARLGMTNSRFTNPTGDDDPNQVVTARDLARAAEAILNDALLGRIVATKEVVISVAGAEPRQLTLVNSNQYVSFGDAIGVKTGTTELAGECLVNAVRRGGHRIVTVVLGGLYRYDDTNLIMSAIDEQLVWFRPGGSAASAGARDALAAQGLFIPAGRTVLMTAEQFESVSFAIDLESGSDGGRSRGSVIFSVSGAEIARLPVWERIDTR
jgi:D-alanyl-D-alanine carboxypeptidase (penicillin-binding protein 5/6)